MKTFISRSLILMLMLFVLFSGVKTTEITYVPGIVTANAASNLKATVSVAAQTTNSITLSWTACKGAVKYGVFLMEGNRSTCIADTKATKYTVKNLKPGTFYTFVVAPYSGSFWGAQSNKFTTCTKPAKTTGFKVTQSTTAIKLTWKAVSGATGYRIYKYNTKNKKYESIGYIAGKNEYTVSKLSVGTKYKFKVRAYINTSRGAVWGDYSDELLTSTKPAKTTGLKATQSTSAIKLTWKAVSGATGYRIYRYNSKNKKYESVGYIPGKTEYTVSKLSVGTKYKFKVRAYINTDLGAVWGDYSDELLTSTKPAKTTGLKATQSTSAIKLTWKAVSGATGYRIYQYNSKNKKYESVGYIPGKTEYTVSKLSVGTKYKFKVRAYINTDLGAVWGEYTDVLETATKPATPTLTVSSSSAGKASLSWTNVAGESGYEVYYSTKKDSGYKKGGEAKANVVKATFTNLAAGKTYYFRVRAYIKTASANVYGGYKTVGVKIKEGSNKLTNSQATELWKTANKVYNQWFFKRYTEGYVDKSTSIQINGKPYFLVKHNSIDSVSDLKKYLSNYFDAEIYGIILSEFIDYNGKLYSGIAGRGGPSRDFKTATVKSQSGNNAELNLTFYDKMGGQNITFVQKMKYTGGCWIFTEFFYMA